MKFATGTLLATLTAAATMAANAPLESFVIGVSTDREDFKNARVTALHEGAAINWCYLSNGDGQEYTYDGKHLYLPLPDYPTAQSFTLVEVTNSGQANLQFSATGYPYDVSVDENKTLVLNGTTADFWACKNLPYEPYQFSQSSYALVRSPLNSDCFEVTLKKAN